MSAERSLPVDLPAERAALAVALQAPHAIDQVAGLLLEQHFYLLRNSVIWDALTATHARGEPVDIPTIAAALRRAGHLETAGGNTYLAELFAEPCDVARLAHYARLIIDADRRRRLIEAGGQISALAYDEAHPLEEVLAEAEARVFAIAQAADPGDGFVSAAAAAQGRLEAYQAIIDGSLEQPGVPTGITDLDARLRTFKPGQMITLAARPGVGKTALALSIARHLGPRRRRVGFVSLEMSRDELVDRLAAMESGLPLDRIVNYELSPHQYGEYMTALGVVNDWPLHIDDTAGQTISTIRARARRLHSRYPLGLLIIDYLQLITPPAGAEGNENAALTTISRGIKLLAKELNVPVLALAQLNRAVEGRASKIPQLSDLRGSGSIEQDSDVVLFIHREELYDARSERKGVAEIHIAKHRNGPTAVTIAQFDAARATFRSLSRYEEPDGYV